MVSCLCTLTEEELAAGNPDDDLLVLFEQQTKRDAEMKSNILFANMYSQLSVVFTVGPQINSSWIKIIMYVHECNAFRETISR